MQAVNVRVALMLLGLVTATVALYYAVQEIRLWQFVAYLVGFLAASAFRIVLSLRALVPPTAATVPGGLTRAVGERRRTYVAPAELPPPPGQLIGRERDISELCARLIAPDLEKPPIVTITGPSGVGKTALALWAAHQVADRYPDGQLMMRFDGRSGKSVDDVLAVLFRSLRSPQDPRRLDGAALDRWYHEVAKDRRILVVLDNVDSRLDISRLLPMDRGSAAIVTTRADFEISGWRRTLSRLDAVAALRLLEALLTRDRVVAEPEAAARLVEASAGYPVALEIAAAALAGRRNWSLAAAVLLMNVAPVPEVAFSGILDLAVALLTDVERAALTLLSLTGEPTVSSWMLAPLFREQEPNSKVSDAEAEQILARLAEARLVDRRFQDVSGLITYRVPGYVRRYGRARAADDTSAQQRAQHVVSVQQENRDAERPDAALRRTVYRYLGRGQLAEALDSAREVLALSRRFGSVERGTGGGDDGERLALVALAEVYAELGWIDLGLACARETLARRATTCPSWPRSLRVLGVLERRYRHLAESEGHLQDAVIAAGGVGDDQEQIRALRDLAATAALAGHLEAAEKAIDRADRLCAATGYAGRRRLPGVLWAMGVVLHAAGESAPAEHALLRGDRLSGEAKLSQQLWRPWIRYQRALVALETDRPELARQLALSAVEGFTHCAHRYGYGQAWLLIGRAHLWEGEAAAGLAMLSDAYNTLRLCGDRWLVAKTAVALAEAFQSVQQGRQAIELLGSARQTFTNLADERRARTAEQGIREIESTMKPPSPPWRRLGDRSMAD
jgi:tetratricopeptide (TPR) repeat protein